MIASSFFLGLSLVAALSVPPACDRAPQEITVELADSGHDVRVCPGDTLRVRLSVQMGTGYVWQLRKNDAKVLRQLGDAELESQDKTMPGGTEYLVFRFRAVRHGDVTLELVLVRPWLKDQPPAKVFTAKVAVGRKDP